MPEYITIHRGAVYDFASIIRKANWKGSKTYYEVIFYIESDLNIRITNIDTQRCRSTITRAVNMAAGSYIGGSKKGYKFI